ncbi:hypothetical protein LSUCC0031_06165 [Rhodobacterales bacterium LSUCC0031]|nr:hypothetical protein [Rhodobacterales bacterium LSUCC0031]
MEVIATRKANNKSDGLVELSPAQCETVAGGAFQLLGMLVATKIAILAKGALIKNAAKRGRGTVQPATAHGHSRRASAKKVRNAMSGGFGSDIRIKTDVRVEGHLSSHALTIYSWEYTDLPGERFVGVMAQDLLARADLASAVFTFAEGPFKGFYGVNYDQLGLRCLPAEAFNGDVNSLLLQEHATA